MRVAVAFILLFSGCMGFVGGCWEDGRAAVWTEPGLFERLDDANWTLHAPEDNMPPESRFAGHWVWLYRDLGGEDSIRIGSRDGAAFIGGIIRSAVPDQTAASIVEAFVQDHVGIRIDGADYLAPRQPHDSARLFRGTLPADLNVSMFLTQNGTWQPASSGAWNYHVGADRLFVLVPTRQLDGITVDAGDRVQGPFVDGEEVTDQALQDAAKRWWRDHDLGAPRFLDFDHATTTVCT